MAQLKTELRRSPFSELVRCLLQKGKLESEELVKTLGASMRKCCEALDAQAVMLLMLEPSAQSARFQNVYFSPSLYGPDEAKRRSFVDRARAMLDHPVNCCSHCEIWDTIRKSKCVVYSQAAGPAGCFQHLCQITGVRVRSLLAAPVTVGDLVAGCIEAMNKIVDGVFVDSFSPEDQALLEQLAEGLSLAMGRTLRPEAPVDEVKVAQYVARVAKLQYEPLGHGFHPDLALFRQVGEEKLQWYKVVPLEALGSGGVKVAVSNPFDRDLVQDFETGTGLHVAEVVVAPAGGICAVLSRPASKSSEIQKVTETFLDNVEVDNSLTEALLSEEASENAGPIINLANRLIEEAHAHRASDIHIEPQEKNLVIRYRVDGVCRTKHVFPRQVHRPLVSRIKIMSNLDIAERRLPQDGRISFSKFVAGVDVDLRVSVVPANHGESIVLRLLDKQRSTLPLDKLGFSTFNLELYRRLIKTPYGMILHCGPTGSGKSMTLYAALNEINSPEVKIVTAEDPIEYTLPGLVQVQTHQDIGLSFAACLRSFLRHDPDIILVGEIRDRETAGVAIEAALSGHLLFSTLHTNDAVSSVTRLIEMQVEPFLVSSTLVAVCAQRLMRRLCLCKELKEVNEVERQLLSGLPEGAVPDKLWRAAGCETCEETGYEGRTGIHELLVMTDELRGLVARAEHAERIKAVARHNGM
ncbi:MAG: ATPase, T2SS/T4P/T4SS family, partial [Planctomycetota bacterium]